MNVSAQDKATNKQQQIRIQASGGLSDADIEKMVKDAMHAFNSLSKAERKARFGEVKSLVKNYHQQQNEGGSDVSTNTLLYAILAILLPPLAVGLHEGGINNRFWISLLLSLLFFLPGIIYALIVVLT